MAHDDGRDGKAVTLGLSPSFGFGDRIGLAPPGHVQALRAAGVPIQPISRSSRSARCSAPDAPRTT